MSAEPTMANNAEDIENNMVSRKGCVTVARTQHLSTRMYWVMISQHFSVSESDVSDHIS